MGDSCIMEKEQKIMCPIEDYEESWILLPDIWLGKHAAARDAAVEAATEAGLGPTLTSFAISLALMDDHSLPGLNGNPERWDSGEVDLRVITWVNHEVLPPFFARMMYRPPRSPESQSGSKEPTDQDKAGGTSVIE